MPDAWDRLVCSRNGHRMEEGVCVHCGEHGASHYRCGPRDFKRHKPCFTSCYYVCPDCDWRCSE